MNIVRKAILESVKVLMNEKYRRQEKVSKDDFQSKELASKETSDAARRLVDNNLINLSAVAQEVDTDASSNQSAQSSVRKEVLGLGSDGKPDGKPMRSDYAKAIIKLANKL